MTRRSFGRALALAALISSLSSTLAGSLTPERGVSPTRAQLQAYALEAATLLKADRDAAIRRGVDVSTLVDASSRAIRSGATARTVLIPADVRFDTLLPQTCRQHAALSTISFFGDGMSCGGTIALTRLETTYEIRVNWLTGRVEIVSRVPLAN